MAYSVLLVIHLGLLAVWLGSMLCSLVIVQPRAARFLGADDDALEEFLTVLGSGNRRPVLAVIAGLVVSGALLPVAAGGTTPAQGALLAAEGCLLVLASILFARVSWRLWPRRVFALPEERPAHRQVLRRYALAMVGLVGTAFVLAVVVVTA